VDHQNIGSRADENNPITGARSHTCSTDMDNGTSHLWAEMSIVQSKTAGTYTPQVVDL